MKNPNFWIVDAFVGQMPGRWARGNPAAIVLLESFPDDDILAEIANEMNFSETAFLMPQSESDFHLRWFTPVEEVDLCGHATLASAVALFDNGIGEKSLNFSTRSGVLVAQKSSAGVELDFPTQNVDFGATIPAEVMQALGWGEVDIKCEGHNADDDWLIEVDERHVQSCGPNFESLAQLCRQHGKRGVIVTAVGLPGSDYDFSSRFFAPILGINEDAVTGSTHTKLAPFWGTKLGKRDLRALQLSLRGGVIEMSWRGERVILRGQGQIRVRGELLL